LATTVSLLLPGGIGALTIVAIIVVPMFLNSRTQPRAASNARIERPVTAKIQSALSSRNFCGQFGFACKSIFGEKTSSSWRLRGTGNDRTTEGNESTVN
jgi:hypothetical protein